MEPMTAAALDVFFRDDEAAVRELDARGAFLSPVDGFVAFRFGAEASVEREREDRGALEPMTAAALDVFFRDDEAAVRELDARGAFLSPVDGFVAFRSRERKAGLGGLDRPDPAGSPCAVGASPLAGSAGGGASVEGSGTRGPQACASGVTAAV
ncbi:MAG: hypothetical protein E6J39_01450 [Chloroflexi bacterium]|nr:MAG: hypothetical protein E6J39_01450 [Chloroflexota bacterium]